MGGKPSVKMGLSWVTVTYTTCSEGDGGGRAWIMQRGIPHTTFSLQIYNPAGQRKM